MHRRITLPVLAVVVLAATACDSGLSPLSTSASTSQPAATSTTLPESASTTGPPSTSTSAAATSTTATPPPATTTTTVAPVPPPDSPEGYAFAVFTAWVAGDLGPVAALVDPAAAAALAVRPYAASDLWEPPSCGAAAGSTYCQWAGATDMLVIRVGNELASQGGAAVREVRFDPLP
ncbi:MAG: hypothetical protein KQH83_07740 [Actinobacteria bacterium]|nr:hypothetical protein [Actinomycetota bacterium]